MHIHRDTQIRRRQIDQSHWDQLRASTECLERSFGHPASALGFLEGHDIVEAVKNSAADREVSSVLRAIGVSDELALASLRIGMGKANNSEEMDMLLADLKLVLPRLRELSAHTV